MSLSDRTTPAPEEYESYKVRFNNWTRWGAGDQLGTLNHITDEVRRNAAASVRLGRTVSLARPIATAAVLPPARNPTPAEHRMHVDETGSGDYIGLSYHGFANTHIDALCHIFTRSHEMYGGHPSTDVTPAGALRNGIDAWRAGIVTRGILLDVPRHRGTPFVTADEPVHGWEMDDIVRASGIEPRPGDAILVRAGATEFWAANPDHAPVWSAPGVHASALEFLYEYDSALLGWDLMEAPGQDSYHAPAMPIHSMLPYMGLVLLDNADFDALAVECDRIRRWEFLLVVAPLVIAGGTGSPVNPIAVL